MKNLNKDIKNNNFKNLYLLYGNDVYLMESYSKTIKSTIISEENEIMNFDLFSGNKSNVEEIINSINTMPFLSEKRLVYVKNSGFFLSSRKNEADILLKNISNIFLDTILIFFEEEIDKRSKFFKEFSKIGSVVEIVSYSGKDLLTWIKKKFKENGIEIKDEVSEYLIKTSGTDMKTLLSEILKLSDFKGCTGELLLSDIDKVCTKSSESKVFDLISEIGNKNSKKAIELYNNMIKMKESPFLILSLLSRQFKIIYLYKRMLNEGYDRNYISSKAGINPYFSKEYEKQSINFSEKELKNALEDCLLTDYNIKTGKINDETGVSVLVLKYSSKIN